MVLIEQLDDLGDHRLDFRQPLPRIGCQHVAQIERAGVVGHRQADARQLLIVNLGVETHPARIVHPLSSSVDCLIDGKAERGYCAGGIGGTAIIW